MRFLDGRPRLHEPRAWRSLCAALRDPPRSDFAFVAHQYIHAPRAAEREPLLSPSSESTPVHSRRFFPDTTAEPVAPRPSQRNAFFARHVAAAGLAGAAAAWVALFPVSPARLYDMQVDVFGADHRRAAFFLRQCPALGRVLGAAAGGCLGDRLGRVGALELAAVPLLLGWVAEAAAYGQVSVILGRYLLGAAAGLAAVVAPVHVAEVAAGAFRGRAQSLRLAVAWLGALCYLGVAAGLHHLSRVFLGFNLTEWRALAAAGLLPALALLLLTHRLPDTPAWLVARHDDRAAALAVCSRLYGGDVRSAEFEANAVIHARALAAEQHGHRGAFYRPLLLCCALGVLRAAAQFFAEPSLGCAPTEAFALSLLGVELQGGDAQLLAALALAWVAGALGIAAAFFAIDTGGRQLTLRAGCYVAALAGLLLLAVTDETRPLKLQRSDAASAAALLLLAGHQLGLGVVPAVLASELFGVKQRLSAVSVVVICEAAATAALTQVAPRLRDGMTSADALTASVGVVVGCNVAGLLLAWLYVPETSGRSLQEIEAVLAGWRPATPRREGSRVRLLYGTDEC